MAPNRNPAARLYAPVEVRPRPQWTTLAEQGNAVVLSALFSPPARVGVGRGDVAWDCRCCDVGGVHRCVGEDCGVGQRAAFPFLKIKRALPTAAPA